MPTTDLDAARRHHRALKQFFISSAPGEAPDLRALRRVLTLCDAASAAARDEYCRDKLRLVSGYAAEMLGRGDHGRWGCDSMTGSEFLRQQVLNALDGEAIASFRGACERLADDAAARVVVLRGAGPAFLSGGDVAVRNTGWIRVPRVRRLRACRQRLSGDDQGHVAA